MNATVTTHANTTTPEVIFEQLDAQFRMSPMLKLRGTLAYRAAKLAGMLMAKQAKFLRAERHDLTFAEACALAGRSIYDWSEQTLLANGEEHEAELLSDMGLETADMYQQLKAMVMYGNKLNFDLLELADPNGKRRMEAGTKFVGVFHTNELQRQSWKSSVLLHAEAKDSLDTDTYEDYVAKVDDDRFTVTKEQWESLVADDVSLFETHVDIIVELILDIGDDECDFDELPVRTQIGLIESMRSKLDSIKDSCIKSVRYMRGARVDKIAEASKVVGIVHGMDKQFTDMLDAPRYANYAEFMYNYIPNAGPVAVGSIKTRRALVKQQPVGRVSDVQAQRSNIADDDLDGVFGPHRPIERAEHVRAAAAAFPSNPSKPTDKRVNGVVV